MIPRGTIAYGNFFVDSVVESKSKCTFCKAGDLLEGHNFKVSGPHLKISNLYDGNKNKIAFLYSRRPSLQKRSFHSTKLSSMATIVKEVPTMGDSITEGTLIEWSKSVGDKVEVDDVVCIVETDKVSVDIRSEDAGVLMEVFADIDDTVEVGKPLFSLDTEGTATNSSSDKKSIDNKETIATETNVSSPISSPPPATVSNTFSSSLDGGPSGYIPSIQFRYGKRERLHEIVPSRSVPKSIISKSNQPVSHTPGAKDFIDMPAMYGRPVISLEEMDAIDSGGAF